MNTPADANPQTETYTVEVLCSGLAGLLAATLQGPAAAAAAEPPAFTCTLSPADLEASWDPATEGLEGIAEWMFTVGNLEPDDLDDPTARRVAAAYRRCGRRSLPVGDRVRVTAPDGTRELWGCASVGWDLLERNGQPICLDPVGADDEPAGWTGAADPW